MALEGHVDARTQLNAEQWAYLIDELQIRMIWDEWQPRVSTLVWGEGPYLHVDTLEKLQEAVEWIYTRVWPTGHTHLRQTIRTMGLVLTDLLFAFNEHRGPSDSDRGTVSTERFYRIKEWDPSRYHRLLEEYISHVDVIAALTYELTRYSNLVADIIRQDIDAAFRFEQGVLTVREADALQWAIYRPEFTEQERAQGQPYKGPDEFRKNHRQRKSATVSENGDNPE